MAYPIQRRQNARMPINIGAILGVLGKAGVFDPKPVEANPYMGMEPADVPYTDSGYDAAIMAKASPFKLDTRAGKEAFADYSGKTALAKQGQEAAIGLENQRSANQIKESAAKARIDAKAANRAKEEDTKRKVTEEERQFRVIGKQLLEAEGPGDAPYYMADPEQQALFLGQRANVLLGDTFKNKGYTQAELDRQLAGKRSDIEMSKAADDELKRQQDLKLGKSDLKADRQALRFKRQEQPGILAKQGLDIDTARQALEFDKQKQPGTLAKQQLEIDEAKKKLALPSYIPFSDAGALIGEVPPSTRTVIAAPATKPGYDPDSKSFTKGTAPSVSIGDSLEEQAAAYDRELAVARAKMAARKALEEDIKRRRLLGK